MKLKTLVFLLDRNEERVLLALKKRGFGEGKWNGVGGKVEDGETVLSAALREAHEEIGVRIAPNEMRAHGVLSFSFAGMPELTQDVHVFCADRWQGEPTETDEMRPVWYRYAEIPYDAMWIDDQHWLPLVLAGKTVRAAFELSPDGREILDMEIDANLNEERL